MNLGHFITRKDGSVWFDKMAVKNTLLVGYVIGMVQGIVFVIGISFGLGG